MGAAAPKPFAPPEAFDEFRLLHPIGRGGMGMVFLGHDVLLDRPVAVKFIAASEPQARDLHRFQLEARAVARLQHPNVVSVYRVGVVEGHPFLVSELVRGQPLSRAKKPMPWQQALQIGIGLARGLAAAHRQGVLHRDIKPGNIMLTRDGEVKLLDFGLAKLVAALPGPVTALAPQEQAFAAAQPEPVPLAQDLVSHGPLTEQGMVVGTPLYMAPETLHSEQSTKRSDVYSLGAVLYEICTGQPPATAAGAGSNTVHHSQPADLDGAARHDPAPLSLRAPGIDLRFAAAIMRCLRADPAQRFAGGDEVRDALEQLVQDGPAAAVPEGNPYRGLLAFGAEHRALFFGRGVEIGAILDKLRTEPMVLVAGDSGVGKSSLCRAGVLPLVAEGALDESRTFTVLRMVPGRHPLAELTAVLAPVLRTTEEALAAELAHDPAAVCRALRRSLGRNLGLILFIDQLEELTTISALEEALLLGRVISELATFSPALRLLCTARGDFLTRLAAIDGLGDEIVRALYLLRPLSADGIREAIVGPARRKQVVFEFEYMIQTLVESTTQAAGGLPLLQFALAELWDARDQARGVIPDTALQTVGGVAGALSRHADGVLLGLTQQQRQAARRILTRLVTLDGTRARCEAADLGRDDAAQRGALEALVRGRLVVVSHSEGEPVFEMAHEALIEGWATLRRWLEADAELRALVQRVQVGAAEWERLGRRPEALWGRRQLQEAAGLGEHDLPQREAAFLLASRRSARRLRYVRSGLLAALPVLLLLGYGAVRYKARRDLERVISGEVGQAQAILAEARQQRQRGEALHRQALALFDGGPAASGQAGGPKADPQEAAEQVWQQALARLGAAKLRYVDGSNLLEAAFLTDVGRADVRGLLGDVTYERVLLSELLHDDSTTRADLISHLNNYDPDGSRRRALNAPATLLLRGVPPGSRLVLQRCVDHLGRRSLEAPRELAGSSSVEVPIPSGSYLLTVTAAGLAPLLNPLVADRGERVELDLRAPPTVPAGYAYVPPGRFLLGSADPEILRRGFFNAPPLHQVVTGGYLIGRDEVTFADWLEFLRDLPPAERARRLPRVDSLDGGLILAEERDHVFRLTLRPTTRAYTAREGELIRYPARRRRAAQDWRRFPVSAISAEDGQAYADWLARTGRLPGARLCDEHEWERAARGADDRLYPSGDVLAPDDADIDVTYGREPLGFGPDEVGSHPASDSPFGVHDMAGNVWELTSAVQRVGPLVIRGGSWYQGGPTPRVNNCEPAEPTQRHLLIGLRVCATYPVR